ncbi:MAG: hypothetical protein IPJ77_09820 [Planctomycetes bacterium]|nr:hypothetical protein [Planctomycetota bacterium]
MIAITVLLVAVLGTFVAQLASHSLLRQSRETNLATADLAAAMEQMLVLPADQIPLAGRFPPGQPIAAFDGLHLANERIVPTYPGFTGPTPPDPLPIVLTLTFDDSKGRQRVLRLASMKTR